MKMTIALLLLLTHFNLSAASLLPVPLNRYMLHKTTKEDVEKELGKAQLVEGKAHYWERDGMKYALKLDFDQKGKLEQMHFTFSINGPSIKSIAADFSKARPYGPKYFAVIVKSVEYVFDPALKTIYSIRLK